MKVLHYVDQQIVTGDEIASAVLEYAKALALTERSDVVHVPAYDQHFLTNMHEFLIGPASQIVASDADPFPAEELTNAGFVDEIHSRIRALTDHSHSVNEADYLNADADDAILDQPS